MNLLKTLIKGKYDYETVQKRLGKTINRLETWIKKKHVENWIKIVEKNYEQIRNFKLEKT